MGSFSIAGESPFQPGMSKSEPVTKKAVAGCSWHVMHAEGTWVAIPGTPTPAHVLEENKKRKLQKADSAFAFIKLFSTKNPD